ncbi:MAG: ATP-binding cassette domain-containing protein [Planctomycetota bacterium]
MPPIIDVRELCKFYGPHRALDQVTFAVDPGGVVGFLGVNGAGKSTLMRILAGFLQPTSGSACVNGLDVAVDPLTVKRNIGYLPETNPLYPELRVHEFLHYRARLRGLGRARRAAAVGRVVERCWLTEVADRVIGQLSKGYRQRVGLAECLLSEGPLLILDEPTVGLDPNQVRATRSLVAEIAAERTVFLSTHILHEAGLLCREVIIIHGGRILTVDTPQALCAKSRRPRSLTVEAAPNPDLAEALRETAGVASVEEAGRTPEGHARLRVACAAGADARLKVLGLFVERGWQLHDLRPEPVRLEDIFAEVTGQAAAPAPAETATTTGEEA